MREVLHVRAAKYCRPCPFGQLTPRGRGAHFKPDICDAFLQIHERFRQLAIELADSAGEESLLPADLVEARLRRVAGRT